MIKHYSFKKKRGGEIKITLNGPKQLSGPVAKNKKKGLPRVQSCHSQQSKRNSAFWMYSPCQGFDLTHRSNASLCSAWQRPKPSSSKPRGPANTKLLPNGSASPLSFRATCNKQKLVKDHKVFAGRPLAAVAHPLSRRGSIHRNNAKNVQEQEGVDANKGLTGVTVQPALLN